MNVLRSCGRSLAFTALLLAVAALLAVGASAQSIPRPVLLPSTTATPAAAFPSAQGNVVTMAQVAAPAGTVAQGMVFSPRVYSSNGTGAANSVAPAATPVSAVATAAATPTPHIRGTGADMKDADFAAPLPDEKAIQLVVGHSVFIDTKHRLSRVYITNPEVLSSYTSNPNQVVVTAKQPGLSTLIVWDEVGDTQVYMVRSEVETGALQAAIKKAFPDETIDVDTSGSLVTLSGTVGTPAIAEAIGKFASLYAKDVTNAIYVNSARIKQVRLKVRFAEVDRSRLSQFGVNLFGLLNGSGNPTLVGSTTGQFPSTTSLNQGGTSSGTSSVQVSNALNFLIYDFQHQIGATIQDLEDRTLLHILAEPTITSLSGEKASFIAGGEFPIPVAQGGTGTNGTAITIQFKQYGVKLDFTPYVNADGSIQLTVAPEVSALDYSNAVSLNGFTVPALSTRRAQTQVVLRDGQTFAISGLLDQRTTDAFGRTPGIASVPVLGALFRSKNINHSNTELVVIVTPEVVDPLSNTATPAVKEPTSPVPLMSPLNFDNKLPDSAKSTEHSN